MIDIQHSIHYNNRYNHQPCFRIKNFHSKRCTASHFGCSRIIPIVTNICVTIVSLIILSIFILDIPYISNKFFGNCVVQASLSSISLSSFSLIQQQKRYRSVPFHIFHTRCSSNSIVTINIPSFISQPKLFQYRFYRYHTIVTQRITGSVSSTAGKSIDTISRRNILQKFWIGTLPYHCRSTSSSSASRDSYNMNQNELIHRLQQSNVIRSPKVIQVMQQVDRKYYYHNNQASIHSSGTSSTTYQDAPNAIGYGQTISAPHMHAYALEEIISHFEKYRNNKDDEGNRKMIKMLDVGCGSGYVTACFGRLLQNHPSHGQMQSISDVTSRADNILGIPGYVYGIDIFPELVELTRQNIMKYDSDLLQPPKQLSETTSPIITLSCCNGWDGLPQYAPYDIIHVGAAASSIPTKLLQQLHPQYGLCIIPIGSPSSSSQILYKIIRHSPSTSSSNTNPNTTSSISTSGLDPNEYQMTELLGVRYVPLITQLPKHY